MRPQADFPCVFTKHQHAEAADAWEAAGYPDYRRLFEEAEKDALVASRHLKYVPGQTAEQILVANFPHLTPPARVGDVVHVSAEYIEDLTGPRNEDESGAAPVIPLVPFDPLPAWVKAGRLMKNLYDTDHERAQNG